MSFGEEIIKVVRRSLTERNKYVASPLHSLEIVLDTMVPISRMNYVRAMYHLGNDSI